MSALIGALRVVLGLDSAAFEKGASAAERRAKSLERKLTRFGESMSSLGQKLSLTVTAPILALAATSVKAAIESREAIGQVEAALKSMGDAAGRSSAELRALASKQMRQSLYDDDEILRKVTANLLTFGTVAGDNFDRAQQAAIDLAARLRMDLQSATLLVGKALNEPAKGLAALRRTGIQFTEQQQAQIKAMVAAGDAAGAQRVMLAELERQFGGSAKAMRAANPAAALKQSWDEFQETIGEKLLPLLPRLTDALTRLLDRFGSLSPRMQTAGIVAGALAAALGPVLFVMGSLIRLSAPMLAFMRTMGGLMATQATAAGAARVATAGFGSVLGSLVRLATPLGALAFAGVMIYENWDKIGPVFEDVARGLGLIQSHTQAASGELAAAFGEIAERAVQSGAATQEAVDKIIDGLRRMEAEGKVDPATAAAITELIWQMQQAGTISEEEAERIRKNLLKAWSAEGLDRNKSGWEKLGEDLLTTSDEIQKIFDGLERASIEFGQTYVKPIADALARATYQWELFKYNVNKAVQGLIEGVGRWFRVKLNEHLNWLAGKLKWAGDLFLYLYDRVVGHSYIPDMVDGIAAQMARLDAVMVEPIRKATKKSQEAFRAMASNVRSLLERLFPAEAAAKQYQDERALLLASDLPQAQKDAALRALARERGQAQYEARTANRTVIEAEPLDQMSGGIDRFNQRMEAMLEKSSVVTVRIAKSFKDMADETLSSLNRLSTAIKDGGFLGILEAVIGIGLQFAGMGAFGKKIAARVNGIPQYASGTSFHPGGLALVGERGPELVAMPRGSKVYSNDNSREMMGAARVEIVPSPYFDARVDQRATGVVVLASPSIARGTMSQLARRQSRRWR